MRLKPGTTIGNKQAAVIDDITKTQVGLSNVDNVKQAPLNSPGLTGTPTAPTAALGTNTTQLANAAFVRAELDANFRTTLTNKDANGVFTTIEIRRDSSGTLYQRSVLSGGTSPLYTTRTLTTYASNGTTVVSTKTFTITYDADGDVISEV